MTTTISVTIDGLQPAAARRIFKQLGIDPNAANVTVSASGAPAPDLSEAPDWTSETARMFVEGLRENAFRTLKMVCDNGGVVGLDHVIETLGLPNGKALGGATSSIGHQIKRLVEAGYLPEGTDVLDRNEEAREFRAVVSRRVLGLLSTACARRERFEADRPQAVAS